MQTRIASILSPMETIGHECFAVSVTIGGFREICSDRGRTAPGSDATSEVRTSVPALTFA
jgi:hypothetical protein